MYACLGVTCHLHFWQNDRGLSLLPTDFSLSFFCFHQTHDYYVCVFAVCVCVCVYVCVLVSVGRVCGLFVGVCACVGLACLSAL